MSYILVDSLTVTTDAYAQLSSNDTKHTTTSVSWVNTASGVANFRVIGTSTEENLQQTLRGLEGNATGTLDFVGLVPGVVYTFNLYRGEFSAWVLQTSSTTGTDVLVVSPLTTTLSTSVGSSAAVVQWQKKYENASYVVDVSDSSGNSVSGIGSVTVSGDVHEAIITGLEKNTVYTANLSVIESEITTQISTASFTTSESATFQLDSMFASYANVSWTVDGSNEVDNQADMRILSRLSTASSFTEAMPSTPDTTNSYTLTDLLPGTAYVLKLQRLSVDGSSWSDQAEITVTTLTTSLNIIGLASRSISINWPSIYDGAVYQVSYTSDGGTTTIHGGGTMTETDVVLRDLSPGNEYVIKLSVEELGTLVGVARTALGAGGVRTSSEDSTIVIIVILASVILAGVAYKKLKK